MNKKIFIFVFILLQFACSSKQNPNPKENVEKEKSGSVEVVNEYTDSREQTEKEIYEEQISCNPHDCVTIEYEDYSELDEKIKLLMEQNAGKILIKMRHYSHRMNSAELDEVRAYLREISKRDGRVSLEPMYMGYRVVEKLPLPVFKDVALLGWDIYNRIRIHYRYKETENYNAKILYHPKAQTIMMIYFLHRSYGDVCRTIYSDCMELEYLDDETFDIALSNALMKAKQENKTVRVNFRQEQAKLIEYKLDLDNLKEVGKSSRLYKWLVLTDKTEKKQVKKERFMGLSLAVSVLDYSLKLYDFLKQYKMYTPVFDTKAEVLYSGNEKGGNIESVTFMSISKEEGEKK